MLNKIFHNQIISRRTFLIGAGKLGLLSILASRMFYMQCIKKSEYTTLSDKNRISLVLVPPNRGQIYDTSGQLLATNKLCFRLLLDKNSQLSYPQELMLINQILGLTQEQQVYIEKKVKRADRRMPVMILDQLSWEQIAIIEEYKHKLSAISIDMGQVRFYPVHNATAHILGYIGQVNEQESRELPVSSRDFIIGKSGIEKYYEEELRGSFGYKQMEVNAFGKYIRELTQVNSIPGQNITLNIDAELHTKIEPYLNQYGCSAIVMNCRNGNLPILAISPSFEPNNFTKLSQEYWHSLINDPYKPLINKAVQNAYPPGSVFKIITILAALEAGITPDKVVYCNGTPALKSGFRCASRLGHGALDMIGALKCSCNSYMYEIAKLIGANRIINMAKKFGFGTSTDIDLPGEVLGFVPSRKWKKSKLRLDWTLGDTLNLSIGQGFLLATPIQLVRFCAAIANNGKLYTPRIAKNTPNYTQIDIDQKHLELIKEAMYQTVNSLGGTAYYSRILEEKFQFAGKTGTAQVQSKANANDDLSRQSISWERRNHAVFIGFAPYNDPQYAISVFVDHGGSGGRAAAPLASKIIQEILQKHG
jgi:penicillin-binding protein 2